MTSQIFNDPGDVIEVPEDSFRPFVQNPSRIGEHDGPIDTVEDLTVELTFQDGDSLADGWLAEMKLVGCCRERTFVDDVDERKHCCGVEHLDQVGAGGFGVYLLLLVMIIIINIKLSY